VLFMGERCSGPISKIQSCSATHKGVRTDIDVDISV
jgi:hypothetical protein